MTSKEQKEAAKRFAAKWAGKGYEKGECQKFWRGLLHDVFDVADPDDWLQFEIPVATGFVDAYIGRTKVLIEQKGFTHGLEDKAAMKQAMMYVGAMPDTMPVRYVVLSNFQEFWIYDKHAPEMTPVKVRLADLPKKLSVLRFLTEVSQKVAAVWRPLKERFELEIDFAWRTFVWDSEANEMLHVLERIEQVRVFRQSSVKAATRDAANTPARFMEIKQPVTDYLMVPAVSSEKREYVPIGFLAKDVVASNLANYISDTSLYHFGVLTSSVHMAWMRVVAGRLEMRYRYSAAIVYNNFPWPSLSSPAAKEKIEKTAQAILDARTLYPDSSLADLYDPLTMPPELRKAHAANDAAVMEAYGFAKTMTESEIVAELFKLYSDLTCSP